MNVLVTGAAGFIGGFLCESLREKHQVIALYHDRLIKREIATHCLQGKVTDRARMLEIIVNYEVDQVYHCAARSVVRNCCRDPIGCFDTNVLGTASVLEACRQSKRVQGILCMESDKSYGNGPTPYHEDQALRPSGVYEASKACAGYVARCYHENYGLPVFTVRSANVYGPDDPNHSRLVPNTVDRLRRGEQPQITWGADKFLREWVYIDDLTHIVQQLMDVGPWGQAVNVGTGETATVLDVIRLICGIMDKPLATEDWRETNDILEIPNQQLDLTKLRSLLPNLRKPVGLREGLGKVIQWT